MRAGVIPSTAPTGMARKTRTVPQWPGQRTLIKSIINTDRYLVIREARIGDDAKRMTVGRCRNVSRKSQIRFLLGWRTPLAFG
jgi:hypothetical protein